jgi:hypothetical protein
VVAAGAAAVTGRLLAGSGPVQDTLIGAAVGAAAMLAVVSVSRGRAVALVIAGLLVSSMFIVLDAPRPLLAVLPWLLLVFAYLFSTTRTLRKLGRTNRFAASVPAVAGAVVRLVVGRSTWEAMQRSQERKQVPAWANRPHLWS